MNDSDVVVSRGIPYARAARFCAPEPIVYEGPHQHRSPVTAPQLPGRLEPVMGAPVRLPQSEDCLELTVTAPAAAEPGSRPVMVWIHGGAYLAGGGAWNLYDATELVRETGIVVVSINYRLGVLGYLRMPGVAPGNLGLLDQIAALEWVREHIAGFGGDPGLVTVAGQSAGAHSIVAMLGIESTRGLFRRAIVQSSPFGIGFQSAAKAQRAAQAFLTALGGDPQEAPLTQILAAQAAAAKKLAGPGGLNSAPPFLPVAGADPLPDRARWEREVRGRAAGTQLVIGTTAEEMRAFYDGPHPVFSRIRSVPLAGARLVSAVQNLVGRKAFDDGTSAFADLFAAHGAEVYRYRVHTLHPDNPFGACHCLELPLLFGDDSAWHDSGMLRPLTPAEVRMLGAPTRKQWGAFVHTGDPGWTRHAPGSSAAQPIP
ncbi:carboxylesterase family protein [Nocardia cyriacigeorgica]|uniref:carboxylesterase family protein n=1 Tax=Nocardia cyriacigeorgica TaxID=135487 RepID=UPI0018948C5A|nr:carboxylesterase family protein [Nocardia cyriacigeorgica]MBF6452875.1 carboxylesterase family protein [Nocardia cyriacigeorgica]MBF6479638.1 carboxylesterase family protein [Nocardia cyriacigeorgica]MBF6550044.1 carboxylesterase family protein [Nocardia cyriacigeorgica]